MRAGEVNRLQAVAGLDDVVAARFQEIVEELHVELVVFHDQDRLRHASDALSGPRRRSTAIARADSLCEREW